MVRRRGSSPVERKPSVAELTKELQEAREHQTATTDVLRIISSSPDDLNAVFNAILANATNLCEAGYGTLWLTEGDAFRVAAQYGALPAAYMQRLRPGTLFRLGPHLPSVQAIKTGRPVHVSDLHLAQAYLNREPLAVAAVELAGIHTMFTVPMFRDNEPMGVIAIYRQEMRPFTDRHIGLVQDFATQAVIAVGNARLLSELRKATLALQQSSAALDRERERLQRILDTSPVGVSITTNNVARFTNPRAEEMLALRVGSSVPDLYVDPEQRTALQDELGRKGFVRDFAVQFRGANGEIRDCLSTLMQMEFEGEQGLLGWIVDVTELTKIQTALSEAKVAAEDADKAKAQFLANMSHEIRTPMNAVIGLAHLCLRTDLTAKQRDYVGKIHNAGTSLLSIINDILDFSKIEAGRLDIENVTFELDSVMNNISTMVAQKIQDKGLELLFHVSSDIPHALLGDPLRLGQVLINLLGNAVKFTEWGEIRLNGELLEQTGDKVKLRFSVRDSGIGLTKEQANRLFQAFSQADTSTSRKYGGTGLGLAISKRLVELMGGSIWVVSEPDGGSTFSFTGWFGVSGAIARKAVPIRLRSLKVLVVDDNAAARDVLEEHLKAIGAEIELVASGAEAIAAVGRADAGRPFDVILLDWRMPGIDGVEAARRIRADGSLRSMPAIIIVTAFGREEVRVEAELRRRQWIPH